MANPVDVLPNHLVAMVAVPFFLGLTLLLVLFDLGPVGWAFVWTVVLGGLAVLFVVGARWVLAENQQGPAETPPE